MLGVQLVLTELPILTGNFQSHRSYLQSIHLVGTESQTGTRVLLLRLFMLDNIENICSGCGYCSDH